jgi:hypothetical protein
LRQELDECLHLLLRQDGQSFIFGDQCVSAHNKSCYPQPAGVAIRHLDDSSGFNSPLSAIRPPISDFSFPNFGISVWPSRLSHSASSSVRCWKVSQVRTDTGPHHRGGAGAPGLAGFRVGHSPVERPRQAGQRCPSAERNDPADQVDCGAGAVRHGQRGQVRAPSSGSEPRPMQNRKHPRLG